MKIMKYLLLAGLCAAVCGANFSTCATESESETRLLSRVKTEYFCRIADIGMEQKRRTYFGDDNFFSEDKIRGIWIKFIKDFIKSNGIGGIKFMSIEYGNFDASKNYSFIVTDKCVYRFHFKYDSITGTWRLHIQIKSCAPKMTFWMEKLPRLEKRIL